MTRRVLFLFACAATPEATVEPVPGAPMDGTPNAALASQGWTFRTDAGQATLTGPQSFDLGDSVLQGAAFSSTHLVFSRAGEALLGDLYALDLNTGSTSQLTDWEGYEDRPVFSPNGDRLAFFSGRTGLASLYVGDVSNVSGDVSLLNVIQLTSIGLEQHKHVGRAPDGYVPPPADGQVSWTDAIRWQSHGTTIEVVP